MRLEAWTDTTPPEKELSAQREYMFGLEGMAVGASAKHGLASLDPPCLHRAIEAPWNKANF